jgi:ATP-dependent helicase Lhr and Lhr-like helicase
VRPAPVGRTCCWSFPPRAGKTEAALLPLLSRMAGESWRGLSLLYIAPLKAPLNNLAPRVSQVAAWLGSRAAAWPGDVAASAKRAIIADPPDILLTTPESIKGTLLGSQRTTGAMSGCHRL